MILNEAGERSMNAVATTTRITPEEFLSLPDRDLYELVDGQLVEVNVSVLSSLVAGELHGRLHAYCRAGDLGWVWPADTLCRFSRDPNKIRKPGGLFVRRERLTADLLAESFLLIPPDRAVEVISPNDLAYDVDEKVKEYLDAGVPLVWVINPKLRTMRIHRLNGTVTALSEHDKLSGEDVVSGFRCRIGELFPTLPAPVNTP
jgi:Uma2 family endonuclease